MSHAVITDGGLLPAKFVIHTVGPHWGEGDEERVAFRVDLDAVVVRVGLAVLLVPALGYPGVLAAQALSPVLPCSVGAAYLRRYARGARPGAGAGERAAS